MCIGYSSKGQKRYYNCKPNKIWVVKGCESYNRSCLQENDTEMYSTHNERKSVVAERFN